MTSHCSSRSSFLLLLTVSAITLSACSGVKTTQQSAPETTMNPRLKTSVIDKAMERALSQAEASGNRQEILATLGQIHSRHPEDAIVATRYGRFLREDNQINAAIRTLAPFTQGEDNNIEALTEMAMAQIAFGDFEEAENYAQQAIEMNTKNARAYLALGTAQDALKRHQDAEISFREGLKNWSGDATPILNNLALNLASQGHLRESLSLLEKALKLSPGRMDLERNRRIIATLVETSTPPAPTPPAKPNDRTPSAVQVETSTAESIKEEETDAPRPPEKPVAQIVESNNIELVEEEKTEASAPVLINTSPPKTKIKNLKTTSGANLNN